MADNVRRQRSPREVARSAARLGAVQALYQMDIAQSDLADVLAEYGSLRLGEGFENGECGPADFAFLKDLVETVVRDQVRIDREVNAVLMEGWKLARLDSTLRAILRAATAEIVFRPDVPARVILNEYIELTLAFFGEEEKGFVNGVLDRLAHNRRGNELAARTTP
jgi:N utilization substance protein B